MHDVGGVVARSAGTEMTFELILRWRLPPAETEKVQPQCGVGETAPHELRERRVGQNQGLHRSPNTNKNKTGTGDVGNSTSSAPACRQINKVSLLRRLLALGVGLALSGENLLGDQAGILPDRGLDLGRDVGVGFQKRFGVLAALAEALAVIGEPGAGFFD